MKIKRFLYLILAVCCLFTAVMISSCGFKKKEHTCDDWVVIKESTCLEKGLRTRKCTVCGEEESEEMPIVAHSYDLERNCIWCGEEQASEGLIYSLSSDGKYYSVTGYKGNSSEVSIPSEYNGIPVTTIAEAAFAKNGRVAILYIHSSIKEIEAGAFSGCTSLISITLPDSVERIGDGAFDGCEKLIEVINHSKLRISAGSKAYGGVAEKAIFVGALNESRICSENGYLYFEDGNTTYLIGYSGKRTSLVLPSSLNGRMYSVYKYAFAGSSIEEIEISEGAQVIGEYAFNYCSSLRSIKLSSASTRYEASAFESCIFLKEIIFSDEITVLGESMFKNCTSLESVTLPRSLKAIPKSAFRLCSSLISVNISDDVELIDEYAFFGCSALVDINIGDGVKAIGMYAFSGCSSLEELRMSEVMEEIGDFAFYSCGELRSVTMFSSLKKIGSFAFKDCTSLETIKFDKTMLKWGGISKGAEWSTNTKSLVIICSDGSL